MASTGKTVQFTDSEAQLALEELSRTLNADTFLTAFQSRIPWPKSHNPSPEEVHSKLFDDNNDENIAAQTTFASLAYTNALVPLSHHPLSHLPSLLPLLPSPNAPTFPSLAIGLLLLLDQGPRSGCLKGFENLWTINHFDPLAQSLCRALLALPHAQRIDNWTRWELQGWSFEHYAMARNSLYCPLAHSEAYADQMLMLGLLEEFRRELEVRYAVCDVSREADLRDARDVMSFWRFAIAGPPPLLLGRMQEGEVVKKVDVGVAECLFWETRMSRVHESVVRVFGRNPYLNFAKGREDTEEEREYFERTEGWSLPPEEFRRECREMWRAGELPPLLPRS